MFFIKKIRAKEQDDRVSQLEKASRGDKIYISNIEKQITILGDNLALSESINHNIPEPMVAVDRNLIVTYINQRGYEVLECAPGTEKQNVRLSEIFSPLGMDRDTSPLARCIETGKAETNLKISLANNKGKTSYFALSAAPLKTSLGEVRGAFMIMRDITIESEIQEKERQQRIYIERQVDKISKALSQIAQGDLMIRLEAEQQDEFGRLTDNINKMVQDLRELINRVRKSANEIAAASDGLAQVVQ